MNIGEGSTSLLNKKERGMKKTEVDTEEKDQSKGSEDNQEAEKKSFFGTVMNQDIS